jgi:tripartite motif-containing protein 71
MNLKRVCFLIIFLCVDFVHAQDSLTATFKFSFGKEGDKPGQFRQPSGISTDLQGNIYVADTGNNRVQKFTSGGELIAIVGGFGWENEQFQRPLDVCADNSLNVYVADYDNQRIVMLDKDLHWITAFYSNSSLQENFQFGFPRSIDVSIHDQLFVVDGENRRILKYGLNRIPELSFGAYDWGEGFLTNPVQLCISKFDMVYVSDSDAGIIFIYDYYGNYLTHIRNSFLVAPAGLAIDNYQILYVTDLENDQILCFDQNGRLLILFGTTGEKLGAFQNPNDLSVNQNLLYVLDTDNNRVQVFELGYLESQK